VTQVAIFVILVFAVPWIVGPWLPQQPSNRWEAIASFVPGVWAPTFIAIMMIGWTAGWPGLRRELKARLRYASGAGGWLIVAVSAPALVTLTGVVAARMGGKEQPFIPAAAVGDVVVNALVTGAVGEEFGWRGFVLSRLDRRLDPPTAALVMAALWTLWHLPIFLFPDSPYSTWPLIPALLTLLSFGVFMGSLFYRGEGSVLPTILAHLTLNVSLAIGGAPLSSPVLWWTAAVAYPVLAWRIFQRGDPVRAARTCNDAKT